MRFLKEQLNVMHVLKEWEILPGDLPHCGINNSIPLEKK